MLRLKPISLRDANEYVRKYHRHHKPVAGLKFSIGLQWALHLDYFRGRIWSMGMAPMKGSTYSSRERHESAA